MTSAPPPPDPIPEDAPSGPDVEALLQYLKRNRGFDFTGYKRASLVRRVQKRMQAVGIGGFREYMDFLEVHPDEFGHLFNVVLINVTSFFRDTATWEYLQTEIVPRLLSAKDRTEPIRVWSAACASGEEAYSLCILLAEALGPDEFRRRVKVYATDLDEHALAQARLAVYTAREVANVPEPLRDKYFEQAGGRYAFHKDFRRAVIFGRHDLIQDAPISRVDLLTCRNTLMYFNAEVQDRVLARLHFALNDGGCLLLGKSETLFTQSGLFAPLNLKSRAFSKVPQVSLRDRLLLMSADGTAPEGVPTTRDVRIREEAFEAAPVAQMAIDSGGRLALANDRARGLFHLSPRDLGRPLQDLELSRRPVELRSLIDQVYTERRAVTRHAVPWAADPAEARFFDVQVVPIQGDGLAPLGAAVTFTDVTVFKQLQNELEASNRQLETAYEELHSANEELETTNEELQSTNEELETTNEELQSTNEELETMNEELQAVNAEANRRDLRLNEANEFLESVLAGLRAGVIVLDPSLQVRTWNRQAEDLWGLRAAEVQEQPFLLLDIGLPVERLRQPLRDCLAGSGPQAEIILPARNRRGQEFSCRVACSPLPLADGEAQGVILLMEPMRDA